jgi:hypothetical protein
MPTNHEALPLCVTGSALHSCTMFPAMEFGGVANPSLVSFFFLESQTGLQKALTKTDSMC